jgi:hypothetical protein
MKDIDVKFEKKDGKWMVVSTGEFTQDEIDQNYIHACMTKNNIEDQIKSMQDGIISRKQDIIRVDKSIDQLKDKVSEKGKKALLDLQTKTKKETEVKGGVAVKG